MFNSTLEIINFMNINELKNSRVYNAYIIVKEKQQTICNDDCQFRLYENKYGNYAIDIIWNFEDNIMCKLGLHGTYAVGYQFFSANEKELQIIDDDFNILIKLKI